MLSLACCLLTDYPIVEYSSAIDSINASFLKTKYERVLSLMATYVLTGNTRILC